MFKLEATEITNKIFAQFPGRNIDLFTRKVWADEIYLKFHREKARDVLFFSKECLETKKSDYIPSLSVLVGYVKKQLKEMHKDAKAVAPKELPPSDEQGEKGRENVQKIRKIIGGVSDKLSMPVRDK